MLHQQQREERLRPYTEPTSLPDKQLLYSVLP